MSYEIVDLSVETQLSVAQVWHTGWHEGHADITPPALTRLRTKEDFLRRVKEAHFDMRVAVENEHVLGFVAVREDQLYQIFVTKAAQGKGVASVLMRDALDQIRAQGAKTAWLSCAVNNGRAVAFYKKCGWIDVGENVVSVETSDGPFDLNVLRFEKTL